MSRVRVAPVAKLPPPGTAALEVFLCDLRNSDGQRAMQRVCGQQVLDRLLKSESPFAVVGVGLACFVLPISSEDELADMTAHLVDCAAYLSGDVVLLPFGISRDLRDRMIAKAQRRDFELAPAEGNA